VIWQIIYSMSFFAALNLVNLRWIRSTLLGYAAVAQCVLVLVVFVIAGTAIFAELRASYIASASPDPMNIAIRYIAYVAVALLYYALYRSFKDDLILKETTARTGELTFDALFYTSLLILASGELLNLMAQYHLPDANKLGLSVLWGVYALGLIAIGIRRTK